MNSEDIRQLVQGRIEQAIESLADAKTLLTTGRSGRSVVNQPLVLFDVLLCVGSFADDQQNST
jgi:hypothetical protein